MATVRGTIDVKIDTCKGCELCVEACPQESLVLSPKINALGYHYAVLIKDNCTGCVNCALVCPEAIITVYRTKKKGPKDAVAEKEAVAVISNVKGNISVAIDEIPEGGVNI
jgi:2-oxoglutarate ferredoxin oxidoreductase subunit delta